MKKGVFLSEDYLADILANKQYIEWDVSTTEVKKDQTSNLKEKIPEIRDKKVPSDVEENKKNLWDFVKTQGSEYRESFGAVGQDLGQVLGTFLDIVVAGIPKIVHGIIHWMKQKFSPSKDEFDFVDSGIGWLLGKCCKFLGEVLGAVFGACKGMVDCILDNIKFEPKLKEIKDYTENYRDNGTTYVDLLAPLLQNTKELRASVGFSVPPAKELAPTHNKGGFSSPTTLENKENEDDSRKWSTQPIEQPSEILAALYLHQNQNVKPCIIL
jgi:hypothetical protein